MTTQADWLDELYALMDDVEDVRFFDSRGKQIIITKIKTVPRSTGGSYVRVDLNYD